MAPKITRDVLDAQQHCRLKAHFRLCDQEGTRCDYEALLAETRHELRPKVIDKIRRQYADDEIATGLTLSRAALRKGFPFVLDAHLEDDRRSIRFDGVKKMDGASILGEFHYVPILFSEARRVRQSDRRLLAMLAVLLSSIQGTVPASGIVYLGRECVMTTIRFGQALREAEDFLRDVERMQTARDPPRLLLNDHCRICEFRERCHAQAITDDSLSLLRGIGEKAIRSYGRKGLFTLTQLAHTFRPRRRGKRSDQPIRRRDHALHALAIRDKIVYVLGRPEVPTGPVRIYLDLEGDPDRGFIYLIGMIVCDGDREERHSFWADDKGQETAIFDQFLAVVSLYEAPRIFAYGSYEKAFITRMRRQARRKKPVDVVLAALTNILTIIYPQVFFPTYSNGLKDVGAWLGCTWSDDDASGIQSVAWRARWEKTGDDRWKDRLVGYNLDDCDALRRVTEFLSETCAALSSPSRAAKPIATPVEDLDKLVHTQPWRKSFAQADFEFVNRRAFFDYQRERVFVRSSPLLKKTHRHTDGSRRWRNRAIRPTRQVEITASVCPSCRGHDFIVLPRGRRPKGVQTKSKRQFDIVMTPGAIKRRIIDYRAVAYRCTQCDHCFSSERYDRLAMYGHAFMSWTVYQQITHRLGFETLAKLCQEWFGLAISNSHFLTFRYLLAHYYRNTYKDLLAKIVTGPVLHTDETEAPLRDGSGYVWVFASLESAVYVFRPSREGEFLREMLKDFNGVSVSDFYSAYDGLDCQQQRCLIHLIRDMNRAVLDNPFDQELQSITQPFGALLRSIVTTVDEHGLKKSHLERHAKAVTAFFQGVADRAYESDASRALQERLIKNRHRLFTFIHHDGVPWNNNAAENAIKQFGYYRDDVGRSVKEAGLTEHLVLLSIYQTCRARGISFLRFLLSRERDLDAFGAGKRVRRRQERIELYPRGFVPSSLVRLRQAKRNRPTGASPTPVE